MPDDASAFDNEGNLPLGIHTATWAMVEARFGRTGARRCLLAGLRDGARLLALAGSRRVWLTGSFVTDVEGQESRSLRDINVGWEIADVDLAGLAPLDPDPDPLRPDHTAQRRRYGAAVVVRYLSAAGSTIRVWMRTPSAAATAWRRARVALA